MIDIEKLRAEFADCDCGMPHSFGIEAVEVGSGITSRTGEILKNNG